MTVISNAMFSIFFLRKGFSLAVGSLLGRVLMLLWGGRYGKGLRCFGVPRIIVHPKGCIRLGRKCILRSSPLSNVAGISHPVQLFAGPNGVLELGDHCGISGSFICAYDHVTLGNRVNVGVGCVIADTDFHPLDSGRRAAGEPGRCAPIIIEDNVWLGMNVIVLKGVTIGRGSVIGAGSVVTSDIPAGVLAAGVPARSIRKIEKD